MDFHCKHSREGDDAHVGMDMSVVDEALRSLKEKGRWAAGAKDHPADPRQAEIVAAGSWGAVQSGGNAFDKYERGLVEPSGPTSQLMTLLQEHPELLDELRYRLPGGPGSKR